MPFTRLSILICFLAFPFFSIAAHFSSGHIYYKITSSDSVELSVDLLRDCSGTGTFSNPIVVDISNTCGYSRSVILKLAPAKYTDLVTGNKSRVVSSLCRGQQNNTTCNGGNLNSYEVYTYKSTVHLSQLSNCAEWNFSHQPPCCLNNQNLVNIYTSYGTPPTLSATYYSNPNKNTSTERTQHQIMFGCVNQNIVISPSEKNSDGDSLVYTIVQNQPRQPWLPGYSWPNILGPSTKFDSTAGNLSFTPTAVGAYYYELQVCEYDRISKALKSCQTQFGQILISNCTNVAPGKQSEIINVSGGAVKKGPREIEICSGDRYSFSFFVTDTNPNDSVFIHTDLSNILPNASIQQQYISGVHDTLLVTIFDSISLGYTGGLITIPIRAYDNNCNYIGQRDLTYSIDVKMGTSGGPNHTICLGTQWVNLPASHGTNFQWSVLSGEPFDTVPSSPTYNATSTSHGVGGFISVSPSRKTTYVVSSNALVGCKTSDTVIVNVAPSFSLSSSYTKNQCYGEGSQLNVTPSTGSNSNYTYTWQPTALIAQSSLNNATTVGLKKDQIFWVDVTSSLGCTKKDTIDVKISSLPFPKTIEVSPYRSQICNGDTIEFVPNLADLNINPCEVSDLPCQGNYSYPFMSGLAIYNDSSKSNQQIPTAAPNGEFGAKTQIIYTGSELSVNGFTKGFISSVFFYVDMTSGVDSVLNNLSVSVSCTDSYEFKSSYFHQGGTLVRSAKPDTMKQGWWEIEFDKAYYWDGTSNLLFDICWLNTTTSSKNHRMRMYRTSDSRLQNYLKRFASGADPCHQIASWSSFYNPYKYVPMLRLGMCIGVNNAGYRFSWATQSGTGAIGSTTSNTLKYSSLNPIQDSLSLIVSDTGGHCVDTVVFPLNVVSSYKTRPLLSQSTFCEQGGVSYLIAQPFSYKPGLTYQWAGPGITHNTGRFDPQQAGLGQHSIYYSITGDACAANDTFKIDVIPPLSSDFNLDKICVSDSAVYLNPLVPNGRWSGSGLKDMYTPYILTDSLTKPNPHKKDTIQIEHIMDSLGCNTKTLKDIEVYGEVIPILFDSLPYHQKYFCENGSSKQLVLSNGNALWNGKGVSPSGAFSPLQADTGIHAIVATSTSYCPGTDTFLIYVAPVHEVQIFNKGPFCDPQSTDIVEIRGSHIGTWDAPLPNSPGNSWMGFSSVARFRPVSTQNNFGYGEYPLYLTYYDTLYSDAYRLNVCTSSDSVFVSFVKDIEVDLGPDVFACNRPIDTTLDVGFGEKVLWSTGDTTSAIRITKPGTYWVQKEGYKGGCDGADTITFHAGCLSVEGVNDPLGIHIYPNPANSVFTIENLSIEAQSVTILNPTGAKVWSGAVRVNEKSEIPVSHWASGVYWVQISGDSTREVRRLVVTGN